MRSQESKQREMKSDTQKEKTMHATLFIRSSSFVRVPFSRLSVSMVSMGGEGLICGRGNLMLIKS